MTNKSISDAFARNKTHTVAAIAEAKEESNRYTDTQVISVKSYVDTNKADKVHTHQISDVVNLQSELKQLETLASVQPDWNQNDETAPDYVKNRTHYIDPVDFEWSGTVNFTGSSTSYPSGFWYRYELATVDKTFNCCTLTIGSAEFTVSVEQSMWSPFSEKSKASFGPGTVCLVFSNNTLYMFGSSLAMANMGPYSISNCGNVNPIASVYLPSNVSFEGHTHGVHQGGTGYTSIEDTTYTTVRYRASSLHSSETTPIVNGTITWTYE